MMNAWPILGVGLSGYLAEKNCDQEVLGVQLYTKKNFLVDEWNFYWTVKRVM